jgi:hypothetical protein
MKKTESHATSVIGIIVFLGVWLLIMVYADVDVWAKILLTLIMIPFLLIFFVGVKGKVKVKVKKT